jgi:hypothetical protein
MPTTATTLYRFLLNAYGTELESKNLGASFEGIRLRPRTDFA